MLMHQLMKTKLNKTICELLGLNGQNLQNVFPKMMGGMVSYQHKWTPKWRSTLAVGFTSADDPAELMGTAVTEKTTSVHLNTFWNPVSFVRIGLEYIYCKNEVYDGRDGDLNRLMFSSKFVF